jgi:hypothetical protein
MGFFPQEAESAWRDAVAIHRLLAADFPTVADHRHGRRTHESGKPGLTPVATFFDPVQIQLCNKVNGRIQSFLHTAQFLCKLLCKPFTPIPTQPTVHPHEASMSIETQSLLNKTFSF